jgi:hypothetical protein
MPGAVEHTLEVYATNLTVLTPDAVRAGASELPGKPANVSLDDLAAAID